MLTEADINKALAATGNVALKPEARPPRSCAIACVSAPFWGAGHTSDPDRQSAGAGGLPAINWSNWVKAELAKRT